MAKLPGGKKTGMRTGNNGVREGRAEGPRGHHVQKEAARTGSE